jgi:SPP1 family predicted phage head-tail adaptor
VTGWADHLTVWADVLETPGREAVAAGRVEASRTATMRIRRSSQSLGLSAADRVLVRGRVWNIRSIGDVGRDRVLLEMVIEVGVAA